jgi:hypothetical protein
MVRCFGKKTSATRRRRRRRDGSGRARTPRTSRRRAERRARASERTRVEGALPRSGEETKGGLVRVPSRMSSARASAAEVGIFAAGPDTPTLWPLRRRISSVVPTLVPRRVIIARARRFGRERKREPGSAGSARDSSAARRGDDTRDGARRGMAWTIHSSHFTKCLDIGRVGNAFRLTTNSLVTTIRSFASQRDDRDHHPDDERRHREHRG